MKATLGAPTSAGDRRRVLIAGVGVAATYLVAAHLGFLVAFVAEQVTTVWAPTGIAQAALLLWGRRLWPAVWLAAFAANAGTDAPLWTAAMIAIGNTLEAVVAATLLGAAPGFDPSLRRIADTARFIVVAAILATSISATIGVATLCLAGIVPWTSFSGLWSAWWFGDALGAIVVAPVILTTAGWTRDRFRRDWLGVGLLIGGTIAVAEVVFGESLGPILGRGPLHYVIFPFAIVAAVRFGQPATSMLVFSAAAVTIWHTVRGDGPFASPDVYGGLILLQVFMGVLATTGLLLAAAMTERQTSQRRRGAAQAVGEVLANAPDLAAAAPPILRDVCENLEWRAGALWLIDHDARQLRCFSVWSHAAVPVADFMRTTRETTFQPGVGLPGRVWAAGQALWIEDVLRDQNFPRAAVARTAGMHGAFGFPIRLGGDVLGVVEFFTDRVATPDAELLDTMSTVGNQVGQFIGRKRVETTVLNEQRRMRAILETALDAVIGMDHRGLITGFNPAAERLFGYEQAEAVGRELADLLIPPDLRQQHREGLARYLSTSHGPFLNRRIETRGYHADGHEFPIELAITRISGEGPASFTGFVRDITSRKSAEEAVRLSEERLKDADRRKDEFLAMLAHELRNPLAPIRTGLQLVRLAGDTPAAVERVRPMMERQIGHMVRLIDDLLDVSRITSGKIHLQRQASALSEMLNAAVEANRAAIEAAQLQLSIELPDRDPFLFVDPTRFVQVISNLLNNAAKFTDAGGRIVVSAAVAGGRSQGAELVLSVADSGIGISTDTLPLVFDLFTQGERSRHRPQPGLGIGLALARRIVDMHGGRIDARSAGPGCGSEFTIYMPVLDGVEAVSNSPSSAVAPLRVKRRVLIVDDNADAAETLALLVGTLGGEARTAADGPSGIQCASEFSPDMIFLDIGMPGMDGYETCRRIREKRFGRRPVIVALTGWGQEDDKRRAAEAGFDSHLTKPADPVILERLLAGAANDQEAPQSI